MSFATRLKNSRLAHGFTQEQLAKLVRVTPQAVSKWEMGGSYPDCACLMELSKALGVSIDYLLDNNVNNMSEMSVRLADMVRDCDAEKKFHLMRELCWQMVKGLNVASEGYSPDELEKIIYPTYCTTDYGFVQVSNGESPFFGVFPDYDGSYSRAIGDGEQMRRVFEILGDEHTMKAILYIFKNERNYVFEAEVIANECKIPLDKINSVMESLEEINIVKSSTVEIDDETHTIYHAYQTYTIISLLLIAKHVGYNGVFFNRRGLRTKPYLKDTENNELQED